MIAHRTSLALSATCVLSFTLSSCETPSAPDDARAFLLASESHTSGAKHFDARLFTDLAGFAPDPACGDPPRFLNTQAGEGRSMDFGVFSALIVFCVDATDLFDDGLLTEGESLPYDNGVGVLTFDNGDELHLEIAGAVVPSDHPRFDFEFNDPFAFVGGTGQFAGATGDGETTSLVDQAADRTYHHFRGTLIRP